MSTSYTRFNIEDLPLEENPSGTDLLEVAVATENGYAMKRETAAAIADAIVNDYEYTQDLNTTSKKITGAINEVMSAKADITSLATVATSGAYSDLTGKPTIDTALDTTSTNAVENRAVASEINSIKSDITVEGSASGDIATFVDGSDNPLKELKISIEAVQSGSGDPSPTNVRPISGFSGVDVTRCAKNIFDYNAIISIEVAQLEPRERNGMYFTKAGKYSVSCQNSGNFCYCRVFNADGTTKNTYYIVSSGTKTTATFTIANGEYFVLYDADTGHSIATSKGIFANWQTQVEYSENATAYEPYNGNTYNINWQSTAGTVYGGTLNVKTGKLTVTYKAVDMGDLTWSKYPTGDYPYFYTNLDNFDYTKTEVVLNCSIYKPIAGMTSANFRGSDYDLQICNITNQSATHNVGVQDNNYTDVSTFTTAVTGQKLVYKLATPIEYDLTPTEIRSLLGLNNVWADCGSITELKYTRDLNLCINDIIARIEALEGASSNRSLSVSPVLTKSLTSDSDKTEGKTEEAEEETKEEAQNER